MHIICGCTVMISTPWSMKIYAHDILVQNLTANIYLKEKNTLLGFKYQSPDFSQMISMDFVAHVE